MSSRMIKDAFSFLWKAFCALCFPASCLYCNSTDLEEGRLLCHSCSLQLEPLDPEERCPLCFAFNPEGLFCLHCHGNKRALIAAASVFEYTGAASILVKQLKYGKRDYLASSMGPWMAAQLVRLGWPLPDVVVPVPMSAAHLLARGFNQSRLLAESVGEMIGRPVIDLLGRYSGDYSQAGLSKQQRLTMRKSSFVLAKDLKLRGATILLIDDVATTGGTLRCCAEVLQEVRPKAVYALTFCRGR